MNHKVKEIERLANGLLALVYLNVGVALSYDEAYGEISVRYLPDGVEAKLTEADKARIAVTIENATQVVAGDFSTIDAYEGFRPAEVQAIDIYSEAEKTSAGSEKDFPTISAYDQKD